MLLTLNMHRCQHDAVDGSYGGKEQGRGEAGVPEPFRLAREDARGNEDIISGRGVVSRTSKMKHMSSKFVKTHKTRAPVPY